MIQDMDFAVLDWIQANLKCGFLDFLMPKITMLGEHGIFVILLGIAMLFFKKYRRAGIASLSVMAVAYIAVNKLLKNIVARPRPCWINTAVELISSVPNEYSFPSGHTLYITIAATILMHYDKRLGIPAVVLAVLIGFSRLYLYVHFPTDVIAGALLGIGFGLLAIFTADKIAERRNKKAVG